MPVAAAAAAAATTTKMTQAHWLQSQGLLDWMRLHPDAHQFSTDKPTVASDKAARRVAGRLRSEYMALGNDHTIATPHEAWGFVQEEGGGLGQHAAVAVAFTAPPQQKPGGVRPVDFIGGMVLRFPHVLLRGARVIGEHGQQYYDSARRAELSGSGRATSYHGVMADCVWAVDDEQHIQTVMECVVNILAEVGDSFEVALEVDEAVMPVAQWLECVQEKLPRVRRCMDLLRLPHFFNVPFLTPESEVATAARMKSYEDPKSALRRDPSHEISRLSDAYVGSGATAISLTRYLEDALPQEPGWVDGSEEEKQILRRFELEELAATDLVIARMMAYAEWLPLPVVALRQQRSCWQKPAPAARHAVQAREGGHAGVRAPPATTRFADPALHDNRLRDASKL